MRLSIIIPSYNEGKNIPLVLEAFRVVFDIGDRRKWAELIIVDNNSKDDTADILNRELAKSEHAFARTVFQPIAGYGAAIKKGLEDAKSEVLAWTHADLQTDPDDVFKAFELYEKNGGGKILVKGHRVRRTFSQWFFSFGMAVISSALMGMRLYEVNAQPKLFGRDFLKLLTDVPDDFSLDLYVLCQANRNGYAIHSMRVLFKSRLHGESKWAFSFSSKIKTIVRTIKYIVRLRKSV